MFWKIKLFLATYGFFRYNGIMPLYKGPQGRVLYYDGSKSKQMALGNASDYAKMFGGKVIK